MIAARTASSFCFAAAAILAAVIALSPSYAAAQMWGVDRIKGSGVLKTVAPSVGSFHSVVLAVHGTLKLNQGNSEGVSITGDDNIVPLVEAVVEDGRLTIRWRENGHYSTTYKNDLEIIVNAKNIDTLTVNGSGQIQVDRLKTPKLSAAIYGSGDIGVAALDADSLIAVVKGSGSITAAGRADSLDASVAGSGELLLAAKLQSIRVKVGLHGSGEATLQARDELKATIAGSGQISYYGKPKISSDVAGSGRIKQVGNVS
jgi:hypothetical protein